MDWQLIIVGLCVVGAVAVMVRHIVRWLRPARDDGSACGGCSSCASSAASPPVVTLEALDSTMPRSSLARSASEGVRRARLPDEQTSLDQ